MRSQAKLLETDWKTLIVMDACRYDVFKEEIEGSTIDGKLTEVDSAVCYTNAWYETYWGEPGGEIVLVSNHANLFKRNYDKRFSISVPTWQEESWPDPGPTLWKAAQFVDDHPNKRYLIHLVPPHLPYFGPEGKKLHTEVGGDARAEGVSSYDMMQNYGRQHGWKRIRRCYRESVSLTLQAIEKAYRDFPEPIVITADHGEMLGEDNCFGHNTDHPIVKTVPWFRVAKKKNLLRQRLQALGYVD